MSPRLLEASLKQTAVNHGDRMFVERPASKWRSTGAKVEAIRTPPPYPRKGEEEVKAWALRIEEIRYRSQTMQLGTSMSSICLDQNLECLRERRERRGKLPLAWSVT